MLSTYLLSAACFTSANPLTDGPRAIHQTASAPIPDKHASGRIASG